MHLRDDNGYHIRDADLEFLSISQSDVDNMVSRTAPLGMTEPEYSQFVDALRRAAELDGVVCLDVRLKGSSAHFFSGAHKQMAYDRESVTQDFEDLRSRFPQPFELDRIMRRLATNWNDPENRPIRRPFDVYWHLGIANSRSDYDIQICSDAIADRARNRLRGLGLCDEYEDRHPEYRFIKKQLVYEVAPYLTAWCTLQSDILRRKVTIAAFPTDGPRPPDGDDTPVSNQLRPSDWIIMKVP